MQRSSFWSTGVSLRQGLRGSSSLRLHRQWGVRRVYESPPVKVRLGVYSYWIQWTLPGVTGSEGSTGASSEDTSVDRQDDSRPLPRTHRTREERRVFPSPEHTPHLVPGPRCPGRGRRRAARPEPQRGRAGDPDVSTGLGSSSRSPGCLHHGGWKDSTSLRPVDPSQPGPPTYRGRRSLNPGLDGGWEWVRDRSCVEGGVMNYS